jgi:hypothetical protein
MNYLYMIYLKYLEFIEFYRLITFKEMFLVYLLRFKIRFPF